MTLSQHRRAKLEAQHERIVKWLERSAEPSSTQFWAKCDRLHEIERELQALESEGSDD